MPLLLESPIDSPRLILRPVKKQDLEDLLKVNGDDDVTRFLPYDSWQSRQDAEAWYERVQNLVSEGNTLQLVNQRKDNATIVGSCLLFKYDEKLGNAEIGYVTGREFWRQGYTEEALRGLIGFAFDEMKIRKLNAVVETANQASTRLLEKLGFSHEGKSSANSEEKEEVCYLGLLRQEWSKGA